MTYRIIQAFLLFLMTTSVPDYLHSQSTKGSIKYKQTIYFEFENMPADMPKSQEDMMLLIFNESESLYQKDPDVKEVINPNDNTPRMFRRMRDRANRIIFKDLEHETVLEQINFFGKDFLISDSISATKWKVSAGEQKVILGYTCMKAMYKDSSTNLVVFFTPQIPVSVGPDKYGNLPGAILEVQSALQHIIATQVNTSSTDIAVSKPAKGDKITRKDFEKLREEKMKEQREMWGRRDGNPRIIRQ